MINMNEMINTTRKGDHLQDNKIMKIKNLQEAKKTITILEIDMEEMITWGQSILLITKKHLLVEDNEIEAGTIELTFPFCIYFINFIWIVLTYRIFR